MRTNADIVNVIRWYGLVAQAGSVRVYFESSTGLESQGILFDQLDMGVQRGAMEANVPLDFENIWSKY